MLAHHGVDGGERARRLRCRPRAQARGRGASAAARARREAGAAGRTDRRTAACAGRAGGEGRAGKESQGHGMSQPVKTCDQKDRKALIACLAPNRRVEIEINGTKR